MGGAIFFTFFLKFILLLPCCQLFISKRFVQNVKVSESLKIDERTSIMQRSGKLRKSCLAWEPCKLQGVPFEELQNWNCTRYNASQTHLGLNCTIVAEKPFTLVHFQTGHPVLCKCLYHKLGSSVLISVEWQNDDFLAWIFIMEIFQIQMFTPQMRKPEQIRHN